MSVDASPVRASSLAPAKKHLKRARRRLRSGHRDPARTEFRKAIEALPPPSEDVRPERRAVLLTAASVAADLDGSGRLVRHLRTYLAGKSSDVEAWVALIRVLEASQKISEALEACDQAAAQTGDDEEILLLKAELLQRAAREGESLEVLWRMAREGTAWQEAANRIETAAGPSADLSLVRADRYRGEGAPEAVLQAYAEALREDPRCVEALVGQAHLYLERGEADEALTAAEQAAKVESTRADVWAVKAAAEERLGHPAQAIRSLQVSLRYAPEEDAILRWLARLQTAEGDYEGASETLEQALNLHPAEGELLEGLKECYRELEDWEAYRKTCQQQGQLGPHRVEALLDEAFSWEVTGEPDQALPLLEAVIQEADTPAPLIRAAELAVGAGLWETGRRASQKALQAAPGDETALKWQGLALHGLGDEDAALKALSAALRGKEDVDALRAKGTILQARGRWKEVIRCYRRVVTLDPSDVAGYLAWAGAAESLGKDRKALQVYERGLRGVPRNLRLLLAKGLLLARVDRPAEALHAFEAALTTASQNVEAQRGVAQALYTLRAFEEAEEAFRRVLELEEDPVAWYYKGLCLAEQDRLSEALADFDHAVALGSSGDAWLARGEILHRLGKLPDAIDSYSQAIAVEPEAGYPRLRLAECFMEMGDYRMALQTLEEAPDGTARDWRFLNAQVICLTELDRPKAAYETAARLTKAFRKEPRAWTRRAAIARQLGLTTEALECLERAGQLSPDDPAPKLEEARLLLDLEDYTPALRVCEDVLQQDRESVEARIVRGEALVGLGRQEEALRAFHEALSIDSRAKDALRGRALTLARLGRTEEALQVTDTLLERSPSDPWPHYWRARVYGEADRWQDALTHLNKALYHGGGHPTILAQKGLALSRLDRGEEGLHLLEDGLEGHPTDLALIAAKASLLQALGRPEEAVAHLDATLEGNRRTRDLLFLKAEALEALEEWDAAAATLQRAAEVAPPTKGVWLRSAALYQRLGHEEAAVAAFDKALELDSGDAALWVERGRLCEEFQRWQDAVQSYRVAVDIQPKDETALCALGRAYLALGLYEQAEDAYAQAVALNPTGEEALQGQKSVGERRRSERITAYAWNVMEFEAANGRSATKEEIFQYCNVPVDYLGEVVTFVNEPEAIDLTALPEGEAQRLEQLSRGVLAASQGSFGAPRLSEIAQAHPYVDLGETRKVLGYVRGVLAMEVLEDENPELEPLMKMAMALPRRDWNTVALARHLGLGAYEAANLERALLIFESTSTETAAPEVPAPPTPSPRGGTQACFKHGSPGIYQHICGQYLCSACIVGGRCPVCRHPVSRAFHDMTTGAVEGEEDWG